MIVPLVISFLSLVSASSTDPLPSPLTRATDTLNGLFHYFWELDPLSKNIGFFFACGQIGGWGSPQKWTECSCNDPYACSDCYRWWDAVALESLADYGLLYNSTRNNTIADIFFAHSPYNADWYSCTFVDDFIWYGIAYLKVYEWLKKPIWLQRSVALHQWAWKHGWDDDCGGVYWCSCINQQFKDSITVVQLLHFSSKLAYMFPKKSSYLESAEKVWKWFFSFSDGRGLMTKEGLVSTGAVPENCCNSSSSNPFHKCHNSNIPGTSYNQGLLISSAAYLYRTTGDKTYLNVGLNAIEAILANYTTSEGIMIDEPRSYQTYRAGQCWGAVSDPGGDWYSFQGIFMLHLSYFVDLLKNDKNIPSDLLLRIKNFVGKTSDAAWTRSLVRPPFNDICNSSPKTTANYPKFHWWWGSDEKKQIIPPDPRIFFHKTQLRCITPSNSQIFEGLLGSEIKCKTKCLQYKNCSKYLYQTDQLSVPGTDCWLWPYNRTDHSCPQNDSDFNVGIKRPVDATCTGHCGSDTPIKTADGGICHCDTNCSKHLDCCLDYADLCLPKDYQPSCKGMCELVQALPIKGGGYCWCMNGCNPWYTDNNSDGSCCPDYNQLCQKQTVPQCLDARSQGSAFNLFLAHSKISDIG